MQVDGPFDGPFVGPFDGRVVRPDAATRVVVPMPESGDETPLPLEDAAYGRVAPAFYRYRQRTDSGDHTGLVCTVRAAAFADGRVRGHEAVQPARVDALVAHLAGRPARVELVTTLHDAGPAFAAALAGHGDEPLVDVVSANRVRHTVWRVDADDTLLRELSGAQHYISDGHHRVAASLVLWERAGRPAAYPVSTVSYGLDGLDLAAFHRLLPGPVDVDRVLTRLAESYVLVADAPDVLERPRPCDARIRAAGRWYTATWRGERPTGVAGLGVALLEDTLAGLALEPTRTSTSVLAARADGSGGIGFALAPPPLAEIIALADSGLVVPAKTTYFSPKPASGLFVR